MAKDDCGHTFHHAVEWMVLSKYIGLKAVGIHKQAGITSRVNTSLGQYKADPFLLEGKPCGYLVFDSIGWIHSSTDAL